MAANSEKKKVKYGGEGCGAIGCSNARWKPECKGMSFFRFPKDPERCSIWAQNTKRKDLIGKTTEQLKNLNTSGYVLCSKHFEAKQFNCPIERNRLAWNAVPTLFDIPNPPKQLTLKRKISRERRSISPAAKKMCMQHKKGHPGNRKRGSKSKLQSPDPEVSAEPHVKIEIDTAEEPPLALPTVDRPPQGRPSNRKRGCNKKLLSPDPEVSAEPEVKIEINTAEEPPLALPTVDRPPQGRPGNREQGCKKKLQSPDPEVSAEPEVKIEIDTAEEPPLALPAVDRPPQRRPGNREQGCKKKLQSPDPEVSAEPEVKIEIDTAEEPPLALPAVDRPPQRRPGNRERGCKKKLQSPDPEVSAEPEVKIEIDTAEEPPLAWPSVDRPPQASENTDASTQLEQMPEMQETCLWIKQEPESENDVAADSLEKQTADMQDSWMLCMQASLSCTQNGDAGKTQGRSQADMLSSQSGGASRLQIGITPTVEKSPLQLTYDALSDAHTADIQSGQNKLWTYDPAKFEQKEAVSRVPYPVGILTRTYFCKLNTTTTPTEETIPMQLASDALDDTDITADMQSGQTPQIQSAPWTNFPIKHKQKEAVTGTSYQTYFCKQCSEKFDKEVHLQRHVCKHAGSGPYTCRKCDLVLMGIDNFNRHNQQHTEDSDTGFYPISTKLVWKPI